MCFLNSQVKRFSHKESILDEDDQNYAPVFITIKLSSKANKFLTQAAEKSGRTKKAELRLRVDSNLKHIESIIDVDTFRTRFQHKYLEIISNY